MNALLIGINYTGTPNQLQGCIFDVIEMKSLIIDAYGFNPNTIVVLRDDDFANRPTKARILQELAKLVANSDASSNIFLHYSGHGTQITDTADEPDKLDECIVPCDYATAGFITDDEINAICKTLKGVGLAVFDSCRSGTIMDLPFSLGSDTSGQQGFYCFSGCTDSQDVVEDKTSGLPQGAMTMAFISTVRALKYYPSIGTLCQAIQSNLQAGGYTQTPQLSASVPIGTSTPFPFETPVTKLNQTLIQLEQQTLANNQIPALQTQIAVLQQQVDIIPSLEASNNTLFIIQQQNADLTSQISVLQQQIAAMQQQLQPLPFLEQQAALVTMLQNQNALIPGLQTQIAGFMLQRSTLQQQASEIQRLQRQLAARQ